MSFFLYMVDFVAFAVNLSETWTNLEEKNYVREAPPPGSWGFDPQILHRSGYRVSLETG